MRREGTVPIHIEQQIENEYQKTLALGGTAIIISRQLYDELRRVLEAHTNDRLVLHYRGIPVYARNEDERTQVLRDQVERVTEYYNKNKKIPSNGRFKEKYYI